MYKQFLLFSECFQKASFPDRQKVSWCGNGLKSPLKKAFRKTLWEQEKMLVTSIFSFSQMFSTCRDKNLFFESQFSFMSANALNFASQRFCSLVSINPFPCKPWFLRVCSTVFLKTRWEKEQEGHDGPVSLHWLILGNLFKT